MDFVQHRAGPIFALFFLLLALACSRTMYLDVFRGATLRKAGNAEHLTEEAVSPRRGSITDRDGVELAVSEPAQDLSADPYLVQNPLALSKRLAPLLGQSSPSDPRKAERAPRLRVPGTRRCRRPRRKPCWPSKCRGSAARR